MDGELPPGEHLLGSHPSCALRIAQATVSRRHALVTVAPGGTDTTTLPAARELLASPQPTFALVHLLPPHIPYTPPSPYLEDFTRDHGMVLFNERKELVGTDLYDGEIRYMDAEIGRLFEGLRERAKGLHARLGPMSRSQLKAWRMVPIRLPVL